MEKKNLAKYFDGMFLWSQKHNDWHDFFPFLYVIHEEDNKQNE